MARPSPRPLRPANPNYRAMISFEEKCLQFPFGKLIQVLRMESADVMLLEYQDDQVLRFLRRGEFTVKLVKHALSPIIVAACTVECLHWPLARDAPVFRIGHRTFLIAVPGLLYALRFPQSCPEQRMVMLEVLFMRFCDYGDFSHIESGKIADSFNYSQIQTASFLRTVLFSTFHRTPSRSVTGIGVSEDDPIFWMRARDQIRSILDAKLLRSGHFVGLSPTAVGNQKSELLRVCRASGTAQTLMKAVLAGILQPSHTEIYEMRPDPKNPSRADDIPEAYPTISVFTNVIEALELAWVTTSGSAHLLTEASRSRMVQPSDFKSWSLNEPGLVRLVHLLSCIGKDPNRIRSNHPRPGGQEGSSTTKQIKPESIFPVIQKRGE